MPRALSVRARSSLAFLILALVATPLGSVVSPVAPAAAAGTYYVSTRGSDGNPGSYSRPWRTLQKAADSVGAGSTVLVRAGSYPGFKLRRSGVAGSPIRFKRYPGDARPTLNGWGRLDVVHLTAVHHVVIEGFVIQGAAGGGGSGAGIRVDGWSYSVLIRKNIVRSNRSYGVNVYSSTKVTVDYNEVTDNEVGIAVSRGGQGVRILHNRVHHNDRMLVNTPKSVNAHDDSGAVGILFLKTTGASLAAYNKVWGNRAWSYDYGWDGGAFDIYGASNVTIRHNRIWDNENVLETGTGGDLDCRNNRFIRNVAFDNNPKTRNLGLILRCATAMTVAHNTLVNLDLFLIALGGSSHFNGGLSGLRIVNNVLRMDENKIIGIDTALPSSVVIDYNLYYNPGHYIGSVVGRGHTASLATFGSWTRYEGHGIAAAPRFVSPWTHDFRLRSDSPAVDRAVSVYLISIPVIGRAPDVGRFERGTR